MVGFILSDSKADFLCIQTSLICMSGMISVHLQISNQSLVSLSEESDHSELEISAEAMVLTLEKHLDPWLRVTRCAGPIPTAVGRRAYAPIPSVHLRLPSEHPEQCSTI